jgi:hypothetical protein
MWLRSLCLNFVLGGDCHATGSKCILGPRGALVKNDALECELHGRYDVWVLQDDQLLVTDLGFPSEEPKQCLALGVNQRLAARIAGERSQALGTPILTTQHKCLQCGTRFWMSQHDASSVTPETGKGHFCPKCINQETERTISGRLGALGYWCG